LTTGTSINDSFVSTDEFLSTGMQSPSDIGKSPVGISEKIVEV